MVAPVSSFSSTVSSTDTASSTDGQRLAHRLSRRHQSNGHQSNGHQSNGAKSKSTGDSSYASAQESLKHALDAVDHAIRVATSSVERGGIHQRAREYADASPDHAARTNGLPTIDATVANHDPTIGGSDGHASELSGDPSAYSRASVGARVDTNALRVHEVETVTLLCPKTIVTTYEDFPVLEAQARLHFAPGSVHDVYTDGATCSVIPCDSNVCRTGTFVLTIVFSVFASVVFIFCVISFYNRYFRRHDVGPCHCLQ
jgi:hypothetical protein